MARFYDVDRGSITIAGRDIWDYRMVSIYRQTEMFLQDTVLFSGTIEKNIYYGNPDADIAKLVQAAKAVNAYVFIMSTPNQWRTLLGSVGSAFPADRNNILPLQVYFSVIPDF